MQNPKYKSSVGPGTTSYAFASGHQDEFHEFVPFQAYHRCTCSFPGWHLELDQNVHNETLLKDDVSIS